MKSKEFHGVALVVAGASFVGGEVFVGDTAVVQEGFVHLVVEDGVVLVSCPVLLLLPAREPESNHDRVQGVRQPSSRWGSFL